MASSNADSKTMIATLRNEILSFKPGKTVPCDDERVVFPEKLVIGMIDLSGYMPCTVPALIRRALHGDVEPSKRADKRQKEYITDSVSLMIQRPGFVLMVKSLLSGIVSEAIIQYVQHLAGKVGCVVLSVDPLNIEYTPKWNTAIKEVTGRYPRCGVFNIDRSESIEGAKLEIKKHGITDIYELSVHDDILSDEEQFHWLDFLRGCLCVADVVVLHRIPAYQQICEQERKEAKEAKKRHEEKIREREEEKRLLQRRITDLEQDLIERNETTLRQQVEELKKGGKEDRARAETEKRSLAADMARTLVSQQKHLDTLAEIVGEKERIETTLRQQVEELKKGREEDGARQEKENRSLAAEMTKKLESKQQRVETLTEIVGKKERIETTLRQQVEELKKGREEDRARQEKENHSLAAKMTKNLESKQQRVETLTEILVEKEQNETTLRQQVEELKKGKKGDKARFEKEKWSIESSWKKELDATKQRMDQLERETWKLRTNIQLQSEMRSAEHKKKTDTPQRSFIRWVTPGKEAQEGIISSEDNSSGELYSPERSNASQADTEPPNDKFADILKQIADDLSDEAKIDSLGSQLGILQGDIARALKTNMRYEQVTSRGTHLMLKQWREGVSREDERIEMRRALVAAKLLDLADRYVPQRDSVEDQCHIIEDSRQRIDITPSAQGSSEVLTKTHEATLTPDQPHLDDVSSQNQTANKEEAVAASAPSNRERINLDDGEHDADEAMEGEITAQEVQPDFQEPGSAHSNDGYDDIVDALDREMDENDQEPQSAHIDDIDSTRALQISEEPASEKLCCSCCYPFRYSHFR